MPDLDARLEPILRLLRRHDMMRAVAQRQSTAKPELVGALVERQYVTPEMALRVGKLIGNGPTLWLEMQRAWDLDRARREIGAEFEKIETIRAA